LAGVDAEAKAAVAALVDRLGYDTVDAGALADSWRFEPESCAYTRLYLADPTVPAEEIMQAPSAPLPAASQRQAMAASERVNVADRTF
jgi:8-hydroxy-5-deazaflavin:NADPH oxidoreductase